MMMYVTLQNSLTYSPNSTLNCPYDIKYKSHTTNNEKLGDAHEINQPNYGGQMDVLS